MTKAEIRKKFDEIVAFSGVEEFIDTPVKRYSSGMYVRLAFAVAAHLEPEILIVDEVLAVGDAAFQKKCIGKMQDVSKGGRTVLFVSHQMGSVRQLCSKAIQLVDGTVAFAGSTHQAIERYLGETVPDASGRFMAKISSKRKDIAIESAECADVHGAIKGRFTHNEPITVVIKCRVNHWVGGSEVRMAVKDGSLRTIFTEDAKLEKPQNGDSDIVEVRATIPASFLRPGSFRFTFVTFVPHVITLDLVEDALSISVNDGGSKYAQSEGMDYGCVFAPCTWSLRYLKQ
jgi:lipopolysaccharide transport system ATP-binding protein